MGSFRLSSILTFAFLILSFSLPTNVASPRSLFVQDELYYLNRQALGLDDAALESADGAFHQVRHGKLERDTLVSSKASSSPGSSGSSSSKTGLKSSSCEQTYGVLPCTTNVIGNIFLLLAYGYCLFVAAKLLSEGSEMLLAVLDAGLIGGLLLPILGALPDSILILVSGLGGTKAEAQEQVLVGIGLLAGSIVMLLTILWGSCLILGRCDIEREGNTMTAIDKRLTRRCSLFETGVENDNLTRLAAAIMILSVIPYIVAQLPRIFRFNDSGNIAVLIACLLSLGGLVSYCLYQVFTPWMQNRRKEMAQRKLNKLLALAKLMQRGGDRQRLVDDNGKLNETYARRLFESVDENKDSQISYAELRAMLAVSLDRHGESTSMVDHFMTEFDKNADRSISEKEFLDGMQKLCKDFKFGHETSLDKHIAAAEDQQKTYESAENEEEEDEREQEKAPTKAQIIKKAVFFLILGTVLAAVFADPLVDAVSGFSDASHIPSFFVSFVLLPVASNSSEAVSSVMFSARKRKVNMSLTYSQIYGAVVINSTLGLGIFLAMVYARQLVWDFSSEVLVIFIVTVAMGVLGAARRVFPLWVAGVALLLYPLSIGLVAVLDYAAGWE